MQLAQYLELRQLSDADFAALMGCDRSTVSRWRTRRTRPTGDQIIAIQKTTAGAVDAASWFQEPMPFFRSEDGSEDGAHEAEARPEAGEAKVGAA